MSYTICPRCKEKFEKQATCPECGYVMGFTPDTHDPSDVKKYEVTIWGRYTPDIQCLTYECIAESHAQAVEKALETLQNDNLEFGLDSEEDGPVADLQVAILDENPGKDFSFKFVIGPPHDRLIVESHDTPNQIAQEHGIMPGMIAELAQALDLRRVGFKWNGHACKILNLDVEHIGDIYDG